MVGVASIWATVLLGFGTWPIASAKAYDRLSSGDMASREYRPKAAKITMGGLPPRELGRQRRTASSYREVYRDKNYNADPHYGIPGNYFGRSVKSFNFNFPDTDRLPATDKTIDEPVEFAELKVRDPRANRRGGSEKVTLTRRLWRTLLAETLRVHSLPYRREDKDFWKIADEYGGDCEDIVARLKFELGKKGFFPDALRIAVGIRAGSTEGHAVLTIDTDKGTVAVDPIFLYVGSWREIPFRFLKREIPGSRKWEVSGPPTILNIVPRDHVEAVKWYRKAAEQGFAQAQHNLDSMRKKGRSASRNAVQAAMSE